MFWTTGCMAHYEDFLRECEQFQILNELERAQREQRGEPKGLRYRLGKKVVQFGWFLVGEAESGEYCNG